MRMSIMKRNSMMLGGRFGQTAAEAGQQRMVQSSPWAIHPEKSEFCQQWDKMVITALLFTCTVTPFNVGFVESQERDAPGWK